MIIQFLVLFSIFSIFGVGVALVFAEEIKEDSDQWDKLLEIICLKKHEAGIRDPSCGFVNSPNISSQFTGDSDSIGLVLSKTCLMLLEINSTSCPSYEILFSSYPDVIIDPDYSTMKKIKIITITTKVPSYKTNLSKQTHYNSQNNSFEYNFKDKRFVDDACRNSIIESDLFTVGDTIRFMAHNCDDEFTYLNTSVHWSKKASSINLLDFSEYHYRTWLDNVIENCVYEYGKC